MSHSRLETVTCPVEYSNTPSLWSLTSPIGVSPALYTELSGLVSEIFSASLPTVRKHRFELRLLASRDFPKFALSLLKPFAPLIHFGRPCYSLSSGSDQTSAWLATSATSASLAPFSRSDRTLYHICFANSTAWLMANLKKPPDTQAWSVSRSCRTSLSSSASGLLKLGITLAT